MSAANADLAVGAEVHRAMQEGRPLVALESTIITHGMPFPRNFETARSAEVAVREAGAVPATIAIMGGRIRVGLEEAELRKLAELGQRAAKCSRRDIPFLLASGAAAGTTVAATMIIAAWAGIRVFATGGIGGVHRGAEHSFDVSADLQELARTPVAVVCAGPKAILDIGLTLEYLETHGVAVVGYRTDELPAFYARISGFGVDYRLDSPAAIADVLRTQWALGLDSGVVVANPIPENFAMDGQELEQAVETAVREAEDRQVTGRRLTPWLLQRLEKLTGGASLEANVELLLDNARLAAEIALALGAEPALASGAARRIIE